MPMSTYKRFLEANQPLRAYLDQIRKIPGPFTPEGFDNSDEGQAGLANMSVLWVDVSVWKDESSCFTGSLVLADWDVRS